MPEAAAVSTQPAAALLPPAGRTTRSAARNADAAHQRLAIARHHQALQHTTDLNTEAIAAAALAAAPLTTTGAANRFQDPDDASHRAAVQARSADSPPQSHSTGPATAAVLQPTRGRVRKIGKHRSSDGGVTHGQQQQQQEKQQQQEQRQLESTDDSHGHAVIHDGPHDDLSEDDGAAEGADAAPSDDGVIETTATAAAAGAGAGGVTNANAAMLSLGTGTGAREVSQEGDRGTNTSIKSMGRFLMDALWLRMSRH